MRGIQQRLEILINLLSMLYSFSVLCFLDFMVRFNIYFILNSYHFIKVKLLSYLKVRVKRQKYPLYSVFNINIKILII